MCICICILKNVYRKDSIYIQYVEKIFVCLFCLISLNVIYSKSH